MIDPSDLCRSSHQVPKIEKVDSVACFDLVHASYQEAEQATGGSLDRFISINGSNIHLRFAGPALITSLTQALTHLGTEPVLNPDLTICIWDSESTGIEWPRLPWFNSQGLIHVDSKGEQIDRFYTPRGDIRGYNDGRIHKHVGDRLFSSFDSERDLAVYWCENAHELPIYERGAPLRSIFHWWLREQGLQLIHAGAVGTVDGAVLLAGKGGSGKSTTALTCLNAGMRYLSDDYSLVSSGSDPLVHSLYNTAKVRPDNLQRVPHLRDALSNADRLDTEKALFFVDSLFPHQIVPRLPVRAILLPRVTGLRDTSIEPASSRISLSALALSTLHQLAGSGRELLLTIDDLVQEVPSFHLNLGTDLAQIPGVISKLLENHAPQAS